MSREEIEEKAKEIAESFRTTRSFSRHPSDIAYDVAIQMAEWQRNQMMGDAVDGEYWDGSIYLDNRPTEYKDGDRVKIIIVKEN